MEDRKPKIDSWLANHQRMLRPGSSSEDTIGSMWKPCSRYLWDFVDYIKVEKSGKLSKYNSVNSERI